MLTSKVIYELPVPADAITDIVKDNESHQGSYKGSVDFAVPLSTPVLAAASGVVTRVRDGSDKHGQDVNYITLEHDDGELSEYLHLAKNSALIKPGDTVKSGQQINK